MVRITLARIGAHQTVRFAVEELRRYLKKIDPSLMVDVRLYDAFDPSVKRVIWVGLDAALSDRVPAVKDERYDDAIYIDVKENAGVITGANERSVLIAAYRFLREQGIAWIRPTEEGEVVPRYAITALSCFVSSAAANRHRCICIEGTNGYEHIRELIDWMPKAGYNEYFFQFFRPFTFFDKWYTHLCNELYPNEGVSRADVERLVASLYEEIALRSILVHGVGHGWTTAAIGYDADGWDIVPDSEVPEGTRQFLAEIGGERKFFGNTPMNTNLCYSNPEVRHRMTDACVEYAALHPELSYIHFNYSDGNNNHCTCKNCIDTPSDYLVLLCNELDEKLTARGLTTRIGIEGYHATMWPSRKYRIQNPDRFLWMFCPISRHFLESYDEYDLDGVRYEHAPYVKNKTEKTSTLSEDFAFYQDWREVFSGECFVFDYHLCLWSTRDVGYFDMAKIAFRDMKVLDKMHFTGMVNCGFNRASFPNNLCYEMIGISLWDKDADFEECSSRYFREAYGEDSEVVKEYFRAMAKILEIDAKNLPAADVLIPGYRELLRRAYEMNALIAHNLEKRHPDAVHTSWEYMKQLHGFLIPYLYALIATAEGKTEESTRYCDEICEYIRLHECETHRSLDLYVIYSLLMRNCGYKGKVLKSEDQLIMPD